MADKYTSEDRLRLQQQRLAKLSADLTREAETVTFGKVSRAIQQDPAGTLGGMAKDIGRYVGNETILGAKVLMNPTDPTKWQSSHFGGPDYRVTPGTVVGDWYTLGDLVTGSKLSPDRTPTQVGEDMARYVEGGGTAVTAGAGAFAALNAIFNVADVYGLGRLAGRGAIKSVARSDLRKLADVVSSTNDVAKIRDSIRQVTGIGDEAANVLATRLQNVSDIPEVNKMLNEAVRPTGVRKAPFEVAPLKGKMSVPTALSAGAVATKTDAAPSAGEYVRGLFDRLAAPRQEAFSPAALSEELPQTNFIKQQADVAGSPEVFTENMKGRAGAITLDPDATGPLNVKLEATDNAVKPGALFTGDRVLPIGNLEGVSGISDEVLQDAQDIMAEAGRQVVRTKAVEPRMDIVKRLAAERGYDAVRFYDEGDDAIHVINPKKLMDVGDMTYDELYKNASDIVVRTARANKEVVDTVERSSKATVRRINKMYRSVFGTGDEVVTEQKFREFMKNGRVPFGKKTRKLSQAERAAIEAVYKELKSEGDVTARRMYESLATHSVALTRKQYEVPNVAKTYLPEGPDFGTHRMMVTEAPGFKNRSGEFHMDAHSEADSYVWHARMQHYKNKSGQNVRQLLEVQSDFFSKIKAWYSPKEYTNSLLPYIKGTDQMEYNRLLSSDPEAARKFATEMLERAHATRAATKDTFAKQAQNLWKMRNDWWKRALDDEIRDAAYANEDVVHIPTGKTANNIQKHNEIAENLGAPRGNLFGFEWMRDDPMFAEDAARPLITGFDDKSLRQAINTVDEYIDVLKDFDQGYAIHQLETFRSHLTVFNAHENLMGKYLRDLYGAKRVTDDFGNEWWEIPLKDHHNNFPYPMWGVALAGVTVGSAAAVANADEEGNPSLPMLALGGIVLGPSALGFKNAKRLGKTWRGLDGIERFELPDYNAVFTKNGQYMMEKGGSMRADEVLDHTALFDEYPKLRETIITMKPADKMPRPTIGGYFRVDKNEIVINKDLIDQVGAPVKVENLIARTMHELQHNVQHIENMAVGGNADMFAGIADYLEIDNLRAGIMRGIEKFESGQVELGDSVNVSLRAMDDDGSIFTEPFTGTYEDYVAMLRGLDENQLRLINNDVVRLQLMYMDDSQKFPNKHVMYRNMYGEQEARATQRRLRMTAEQREAGPFRGAIDEKAAVVRNRDEVLDMFSEDPTKMQKKIDKAVDGKMKFKRVVTTDVALLKRRVRDLRKGAKLGAAGTRQGIKDMQKDVIDVIRKAFPGRVPKKYLNLVRRANTTTQMDNVLDVLKEDYLKLVDLDRTRKRLASKRSKFGWIRKLGELDQSIVRDIKQRLKINKPLRAMNDEELDAVIAEAYERFVYRLRHGAIKKARQQETKISNEDLTKLENISEPRLRDRAKTLGKNTAEEVGNIKDWVSVFSTELRKISEPMFKKMRQFEYRLLRNKKEARGTFERLWKAVKAGSLTPDEERRLQYAMLNGMHDEIFDIISSLQGPASAELGKAMREWFDYTESSYQRMRKAGFQVNKRRFYFPRYLKNTKDARRKVIEYFAKNDEKGIIEKEFQAHANALGRELDDVDKARVIQNLLRGFRGKVVSVSEQGPMLQRAIDKVPVELMDAYEDPLESIARYIEEVEERILLREFVGGKAKDIDPNLVNDVMMGEDTFAQMIVDLMVKEGMELTAEQQTRIVKLFKARFAGGGTSPFWRGAKQLGYIALLGNVQAAITNLGDLYSTFYRYGTWKGMGALWDTLLNKNGVTLKDLDITKPMAEVDAVGGLEKWMNRFFTYSGFRFVDSTMKTTMLRAAMTDAAARVKRIKQGGTVSGDAVFQQKLNLYFGEERAAEVMDKLAKGTIDDDTLFYVFNELSDFQPITLSEMPVKYLETEAKIVFQMKTWTIKMLDVYRREVIQEFKKGNRALALRKFARLTTILVALNLSAQEIKDFLNGKDVPIEDNAIDELVQLLGINRWTISEARQQGPTRTAFEQLIPPVTSPIDKALRGEFDKLIYHTPVVGPPLYNRLKEAGLIEEDKKTTRTTSRTRTERERITRERS